jgi:hypothetical protein
VAQGCPHQADGLKQDREDDAARQGAKRPDRKIPASERECQDAVMDLAPDKSIYLAFRRDFAIWVARRNSAGQWLPAEQVVREYAFHPSIMIANGCPLITFQHEGLRRIPLALGPEFTLPSGSDVVKTCRSQTCETAEKRQFDVSRLVSDKSTAIRVQYPELRSSPKAAWLSILRPSFSRRHRGLRPDVRQHAHRLCVR